MGVGVTDGARPSGKGGSPIHLAKAELGWHRGWGLPRAVTSLAGPRV